MESKYWSYAVFQEREGQGRQDMMDKGKIVQYMQKYNAKLPTNLCKYFTIFRKYIRKISTLYYWR